jgi:hypothetical protein
MGINASNRLYYRLSYAGRNPNIDKPGQWELRLINEIEIFGNM